MLLLIVIGSVIAGYLIADVFMNIPEWFKKWFKK